MALNNVCCYVVRARTDARTHTHTRLHTESTAAALSRLPPGQACRWRLQAKPLHLLQRGQGLRDEDVVR